MTRTGAAETVIAVDVGGTTIKSALVGVSGRLMSLDARHTGHGEAARDAVRAAAAHQLEQANRTGAEVISVGVVSPGVIDEDAGLVRYASNLGWRDVALRETVADAVTVPVAVAHDARSAGEAEGVLGAARGRRDYLHVAIGTGIAASLSVAGQMVTGSAGGAGELGHIPVHPGGEPCLCGQRGCLEVYASGGGLARRYRRLTGRSLTAHDLVRRRPEDADAARIWSEGIDALAVGLATCALLLEPDAIVLGGGLSLAGDDLVQPLRGRLQEHLVWRTAPDVSLSELGSEGALVGAALLAMRAATRESETKAWRPRDLGLAT